MRFFRAITGPTGIGKTSAAFLLLDRHPGFQILNCDAFQFYKEIPILSNQEPTRHEILFRAHRTLSQPWSAGDFAKTARSFLEEPVLWVGTGLYLGSALYGLSDSGVKGTPFQGEPLCDYRMIVLDNDREELYFRLDARVDEMIAKGAEKEAEKVFEQITKSELSSSLTSLKAIGLRHLLECFQGLHSRERAIELWKRDSRRLAKRQWTWLRKFCPPSPKVRWIQVKEFEDQVTEVSKFLDF
jgi:tRNA A37 N6-isopentenylltransferase MiaA